MPHKIKVENPNSKVSRVFKRIMKELEQEGIEISLGNELFHLRDKQSGKGYILLDANSICFEGPDTLPPTNDYYLINKNKIDKHDTN